MRMSAYPRAFSLYPSWLKPVLLSLGAMFVVTAIFLMILIWKSSPVSASVQMSAAALAAAPTAPVAPAQPAAAGPSREVPVASVAAPVAHKAKPAKHHKVAHHKKAKHTRIARASKH